MKFENDPLPDAVGVAGKGKILQISDRKQLIALQKNHKVLRCPTKTNKLQIVRQNICKKVGKIVEVKIGTGSPGMFVQITTIVCTVCPQKCASHSLQHFLDKAVPCYTLSSYTLSIYTLSIKLNNVMFGALGRTGDNDFYNLLCVRRMGRN